MMRVAVYEESVFTLAQGFDVYKGKGSSIPQMSSFINSLVF